MTAARGFVHDPRRRLQSMIRLVDRDHHVSGAISVVTILLAASCLRTPITTVGPVLDQVGDAYELSEIWLGVLGAVPLIGFALVSPIVHLLSHRSSPERTVLWALLALAAATALRSAPGVWWLWIGTAGIGAAIAFVNVLLPAIVKRDHSHHISLITGSYTGVMGTCAALASGVSAPIALATQSWRWALSCWAAISATAALAWWRQTRHNISRARGPAAALTAPEKGALTSQHRAPGVWRSPGAWFVTAYMGLQSSCYFLLVTWLPTIEAARGVPVATTGWYLLTSQMVGLVAGLAITAAMGQRRDQRRVAISCAAPVVVGALGMILLPSGMFLWATLIGLTTGTALVVSLALMGLRTRTHAATARLSGMAQSGGYAIAALGVVIGGLVGRLVGAEAVSFVILGAAILLLLAAPQAGKPTYIGGNRSPEDTDADHSP